MREVGVHVGLGRWILLLMLSTHHNIGLELLDWLDKSLLSICEGSWLECAIVTVNQIFYRANRLMALIEGSLLNIVGLELVEARLMLHLTHGRLIRLEEVLKEVILQRVRSLRQIRLLQRSRKDRTEDIMLRIRSHRHRRLGLLFFGHLDVQVVKVEEILNLLVLVFLLEFCFNWFLWVLGNIRFFSHWLGRLNVVGGLDIEIC